MIKKLYSVLLISIVFINRLDCMNDITSKISLFCSEQLTSETLNSKKSLSKKRKRQENPTKKNAKRVRFSPEKPSIKTFNISDEEKESKKKHWKEIKKYTFKNEFEMCNEIISGDYKPQKIRESVLEYLKN